MEFQVPNLPFSASFEIEAAGREFFYDTVFDYDGESLGGPLAEQENDESQKDT
jgi:hypothetical protein